MSSILIFGDSIAHGAFDLKKSGWVERMQIYLWDNFLNKNKKLIDINNFSILGDTTADVLSRIDCELNSIRSKNISVIFSIGTNDTAIINNKEKNISKQGFENNLNSLVKKAQGKTNQIYFLGILEVVEEFTSPFSRINWYYNNQRIKEFDKIIQKVSEENNCQFIPMQGLLNKEDLADGLHPNTQGHKKIFLEIKKYLQF